MNDDTTLGDIQATLRGLGSIHLDVIKGIEDVAATLKLPCPRPTVHEIAKDMAVGWVCWFGFTEANGNKESLVDDAYALAQALYARGTEWEKGQGDG